MAIYMTLDEPLAQPRLLVELWRLTDESAEPPDQRDGFWPSLDSKAAGYIGENPAEPFKKQMEAARKRMALYNAGEWFYAVIQARAVIDIPVSGADIVRHVLCSPGVWGVESDSDDAYIQELYRQEAALLCEHLQVFAQLAGTFTLTAKEVL